jgi:hypothetical protein
MIPKVADVSNKIMRSKKPERNRASIRSDFAPAPNGPLSAIAAHCVCPRRCALSMRGDVRGAFAHRVGLELSV